MRRFIETIHVEDCALAYTIMEALEDKGYSVELYEPNRAPVDRRGGPQFAEIKIFKEEKIKPKEIGFTGEVESDAEV